MVRKVGGVGADQGLARESRLGAGWGWGGGGVMGQPAPHSVCDAM